MLFLVLYCTGLRIGEALRPAPVLAQSLLRAHVGVGAKEKQPDAGAIRLPRGDRIGFLAQEAPGGAGDALATVLTADSWLFVCCLRNGGSALNANAFKSTTTPGSFLLWALR